MIRTAFALLLLFSIAAPFSLGCFLLPAEETPEVQLPQEFNVTSAVQWDNSPGGYHHARAYTDYLKKKYADAIKTCNEGEEKIREIAKHEHRDPATYVNLGMLMLLRGTCFYDNGNFEQALVEFNKVVALRPYDRAGHYNVSLALARMERYAEAIKSACRAVELDTSNAESRALYNWLREKIIEERRKKNAPPENDPPPTGE